MGRGFEYASPRGSDISRESLVIILAYILHLEFLCVIPIMHLSCVYLLCIKLYLCDSDIYVIVIYDMCALYFIYLYVISLMQCSFAFASAFYSDANELYYLYSCLFHIF